MYIFFLNIYILLKKLTYNVSGAQQGDSVMCVCVCIYMKYTYIIFQIFSIIGYYYILTIGPCAIQ